MRLHAEDDGLATQFLEVHRLLGSQRTRHEALAMNALEALLLGLDEHNSRRQAKSGDQRIRRAMEFLDLHLSGKVLIEDAADDVGLSPSRLAHLFKAQTGQTVQAYLEARRMQLAADLLQRTSFPVKQVAAAAGFESQFYFSQRFSRWTGMSPTAFRKRQDRG